MRCFEWLEKKTDTSRKYFGGDFKQVSAVECNLKWYNWENEAIVNNNKPEPILNQTVMYLDTLGLIPCVILNWNGFVKLNAPISLTSVWGFCIGNPPTKNSFEYHVECSLF